MAILNQTELTELRQECARGENPDWDKAIINSGLQAVEDWFEANKANISSAINAATSPYTFRGAVKKKLVAYWLRQKFKREGV